MMYRIVSERLEDIILKPKILSLLTPARGEDGKFSSMWLYFIHDWTILIIKKREIREHLFLKE